MANKDKDKEKDKDKDGGNSPKDNNNNKNPSLFNLSSHYETLCNMVIRPPRYTYELDDMGPKQFKIDGQRYLRNDFELINQRGHTLQCSHFIQKEYWESGEKQPCVIYCHGNSGCRLDSLDCVRSLLPMNITILAFDFSGSGLSGGEYVSLGFYEKDDLATVVKHLRETGKISTIGLWGRSMGAVTSILYAKEDPSIAGMVLDSPFSSLYRVAEELVQSTVQKVPKLMISLALKMIRSSIKKRAQFDIKDLDITNITSQVFIPALFAHGKEDSFVRPHHSEILHKNYQGDKNIILVDGDHNSDRPHDFKDSVFIFFVNTLKPNLPQNQLNNTANLFSNPLKSTHDRTSMFFESGFSTQEQKELEQAILLSMGSDIGSDSSNTTTATSTSTTTTNQTETIVNNRINTDNIIYDNISSMEEYDEEMLKQQEELFNSFKMASLNNPITISTNNSQSSSPTLSTTTTTSTTTIIEPTIITDNIVNNNSNSDINFTTTTTTNAVTSPPK